MLFSCCVLSGHALVPRGASAASRPELGPPLARVVTSQDDLGHRRGRGTRRRELGRHRLGLDGPVPARRCRRERSRLLDQSRVVLQPPALVEADGGHDPTPTQTTTAVLDRLWVTTSRRRTGATPTDDVDAEPATRSRVADAGGSRARSSPCCRRDLGPSTALSQCSIAEWHCTARGARATSPPQTGPVMTPWMSKAATSVAAHAPLAGRQPGALQPLHVADRAERGHDHVHVQRGPVGERGTVHVTVRVTLERGHRDAGAQVHAVVAVHLRGDPPDHPAERADQRRLAALGNGHVRPSSRQTEATSEPMNPAPTTPARDGRPTPPAARPRRPRADGVSGQRVPRVEPGARTPADQRAVVPTCSPPATAPGGVVRSSQSPPLSRQCGRSPHARQLRVVGRHPPRDLPTAGAVVRLVRLVPMMVGVPKPSSRNASAGAGDEAPTMTMRPLRNSSTAARTASRCSYRPSRHRLVSRSPVSRSTAMAAPGRLAAARRTRTRSASSGLRS